MARDAITIVQNQFEHIHGLLVQFIDICPDTVWEKVNGKFPVWQEIYHVLGCYDFFVLDADQTLSQQFFDKDSQSAIMFAPDMQAPARTDFKKLAATMKITADAYFASLKDDSALLKKHEGCSTRMGKDMTALDVLTILVGHGYYHLGCADTALRSNGLNGIM